MASPKPLISAVITTHNRAGLLPRALDSAVIQSYENLEVVVVDDGSTDNTPEVVGEYTDEFAVRYIRLEESVGACRARNRGIEEASGEFVAGLDDDDEWHAERISELYRAYSEEYACVTSDTRMVYPGGEAVWNKKKEIDLQTLLYTNQVGNQVLASRSRLIEAGGFDPKLKAAQDYDLWIRLCDAYGPIRNVQKPLQTVYMDHDEGRITTHSSFEGYLQFYQKHKHRFNRSQRKYQLYNIRRAQGKPLGPAEFLNLVPPFRYWSEVKNTVAERLWN